MGQPSTVIIDAGTCMASHNDKATATARRFPPCVPTEGDDRQWIPAVNLRFSFVFRNMLRNDRLMRIAHSSTGAAEVAEALLRGRTEAHQDRYSDDQPV